MYLRKGTMSLEAVETFIAKNGHLPGLKSAGNYQIEGVGMMELNQKLLEKVEELTLYVIQLKKENALIKDDLNQLKKDNSNQ